MEFISFEKQLWLDSFQQAWSRLWEGWSAGCVWRWRKRDWASSSVSFYLFTTQGVHHGGRLCSIPLTSWSNLKFYHCIITSILSVAFLEKKLDDKLRQYSLEGEAHLPGVLGVHAIALLQQREGLWDHGLQIKYGLLGTLKNRESKSILYYSFFLQDLSLCLEHNRKISVHF